MTVLSDSDGGEGVESGDRPLTQRGGGREW